MAGAKKIDQERRTGLGRLHDKLIVKPGEAKSLTGFFVVLKNLLSVWTGMETRLPTPLA